MALVGSGVSNTGGAVDGRHPADAPGSGPGPTPARSAQRRGTWSIAPLIAGFLVVLVGYSGPLLIVGLAVTDAGLGTRVADNWIFAVSMGSGLTGLILSVWTRQPVIVAFSSAGAVLLSTSLHEYRFSAAIGAYLVVAAACVIIGVTRTFSRLMSHLPRSIVSAMLAGVLFHFGTGYFAALPGSPQRWRVTLLVTVMGAVYFLCRARGSRLAIVFTSAAGLAAAVALGLTTSVTPRLHLVDLQATMPTFDMGAMTGLALPLLALALSSQYAPGYAILQAAGYEPDMDRILVVTGAAGVALAPLGSPGLNLAAITAGIATGPDAHPDPHRRYTAGIATGVFYIAAALFGSSLLSVFSVVTPEFVAAITGLALFGTIASSAATALADPAERDAAVATLLCAAAGFSLFHIAAPFWALVAGLLVHTVTSRVRAPSEKRA